MATPQRFNDTGQQGRNCPVCLRTGSLRGDRAAGATLNCPECLSSFRLLRGIEGEPDTLERIPYEQPRVLTAEELARVGGGFSFHDDAEGCRECGHKHCFGHAA